MIVKPLNRPFDVEFTNVSSDKSISHRVAIFSFLSGEAWHVSDFLESQDCQSSLNIARELGAKVEGENGNYTITPPPNLREPAVVLDCGNAGTAMRIYMGLLAGSEGHFVLSGDCYLNARPMKRVGAPLASVGAKIDGRNGGEFAPLSIRGGKLSHFSFESHVASAQVKTALILAGLLGEGCEFSEPELSRDHSEKMLTAMGADVKTQICEGGKVDIKVAPLNGKKLKGLTLSVPNDPSSCFFFAVAAAITNSRVCFKNILLNKTRVEAFKVLERMGAKVEFVKSEANFDEVGEIVVSGTGKLKAVNVEENISWLIDEAPALAVAFACAEGESVLKNAAELRVKECDRIAVTAAALKACGVEASELPDGFVVRGRGGEGVKAALVDSHGDHRIAMSFAVLGLKCGMEITKSEFINTSFPKFGECLGRLYEGF